MRASSVSVVSLALVALTLWSAPTFAQQTTCSDSTLVCRKEGENCAQSVTPGTFVQCSAGTYCNSNNQCARQPTLGNSCTNTVGCFDESYPDAVSCINGVCMYTNLYFPGESCNSGSNYYNGGCAVGSCNNDKCTSIAQGGNCTGAETLCAPGLYCNDAAQCVARLAANSQCSGNEECDPTLVCTRRGATTGNPTCQSPFNQANDQGCDTFYDCAANLLCINQKCTQPATPTSGNCGNQAVTFCGVGNTCDCDSRINGQNLTTSSTGQCERVGGLSSSFINAAKDFQQCAKDKGCQDVWAIQNINDNDLTNGPSQCTSSCSGRNTLFGFSGAKYNSCFSGSSSAAVVMPAILAVLIALVAVLML